MVLYRNLTADWYYVDGGEKDYHIKKVMDDAYNQASTINLSYWQEADTDTRFKAGDQTIWNDYYGNLPAFRRKQFNFNNIRRICNLITGYQRKNRKTLISTPVYDQDDNASDQYNKLMFAVANKMHLYEKISEAFDRGPITTGMSLLKFGLDYSYDPESGDITLRHCAYNSFLIDPYFKQSDLSDCNFIWERQWLTKNYAKLLLPKREKEIDKMTPSGNKDGKFQFMAEAYYYGMQNLLMYDEYYYRTLRKVKIIIDPQTRMTKEWGGNDEDLKRFQEAYPNVVMKETTIPTVNKAICVEGHVLYDGPMPSGLDRYEHIAFLGYYEPEIPYFPWRVQGVVRGLRDSQFLYNRRKVIELDILESQINSGWKYKPTSLVNPNDIFLDGQGRGLAMKQEADMMDAEKIQPAQVPPSMLELSEILKREIMDISGVNEELLGAAEDDKAGILSMLRQGAGLTTLQVLFDQLDFSMVQCGEVIFDLIQKNFSYGKIYQILQEEPLPEFESGVFPEYEIRVEEGANTTTQKQMQFMQLLHMKEIGIPVPTKVLLESATLQNKKKLIEAIEQEEQQAAQMQQQQQQQEIELLKAQIESLQAQAVANHGLGIERVSRVEENRALAIERIADSKESRYKGMLDYTKALKEIQEIDINQIEKLVNIAVMLKQEMRESEEQNVASAQESGVPALQQLG